MLDYLEDLWARLPDDLRPVDFALRRRYLLGALQGARTVLDLGCGQGEFTAALAADGAQAIGAEVAPTAIERARRSHPELRFELVPIDGPLPFSDAAFEAVWAGEVIEHVADTARWLWEVRRVLAPGGRLLLSTPSHGRLRLLAGGIEQFSEPLGEHLHLYSARSLQGLLAEFGFLEVRVRGAGGPPGLRRHLLASARRP
ncbi:MAG TPA: class I SAM-dependent methyltransferase [Solirubrobacteraceae bacterium]|nr:class I SAM-dependent methyltransferase [Solirubrobacteraceae bacterium]